MSLCAAFCETYAGPRAGVDEAQLEPALQEALAQARAAWPTVTVEGAELARWLGARTPAGEAPLGALAALHHADLYLACAATRGDHAALRALDEKIFSDVPNAIRTIVDGPAGIDEALQRLRESLLVGKDGAPPKLADYAGRGSLHAWVRVAAVRVALMMVRRKKPQVSVESALLDTPAGGDAELEYLRRRYQHEFREAFALALAALAAEERNLIELVVIEGVTMDQIGAMHRVNKSTVSRWLTRAKETLFRETRRALQEKLRLSESDLESLMGLVRSQLDVSLHRLLKQ